MATRTISDSDTDFLNAAARYLENPSFLMRVADTVGRPLEGLLARVPAKITEIATKALRETMLLAANTIRSNSRPSEFDEAYQNSRWTGLWHRVAATVTGGIGGAFGFAGLAIELPITTAILFRSIASIADDNGEDISSPEVRMECLTVFSHGGPSQFDDALDSTYLSTRLAMAHLVREASQFVAETSSRVLPDLLAREAAPTLINFINKIGMQFNVRVTQKFLAQSIPLIGIATGSAINNAFAGHFNSVATYHFGIRRLERKYGQDLVHTVYRQQLDQIRPPEPSR